jgi:hypothetical protein
MDELPSNPRAIYMNSLWWRQMITLPLELKGRYIPLRGNLVRWQPRLHRNPCPPDTSLAIPPRVPRFQASRRARNPYPPAEPPILVFWLNQVTQRFCGEPLQTPCADSSCEPLPYTSSCPWLRFAFLANCGPHLTPLVHRVHWAKPTCLSTRQRPRKAKTFRTCLSPAPTEIKVHPTPVRLSQGSVHTTLSIIHH